MSAALSLLAPTRLWFLVIPAALTVAFVVSEIRRRAVVARFTNLELLAEVAPERPRRRRRIGPLLGAIGLVVLTVAFARPAVTEEVQDGEAVVVLALDTSLSMAADDVVPNRIGAARAAARRFVENVPDGVRVGLVSFAGTASLVVAPTDDGNAIAVAIDELVLAEGTAAGDAVTTAVGAIDAAIEGESSDGGGASIVLLSDGETTMGRTDVEGAEVAAADGIPVHTIAFGTDSGVVRLPTGEVVPVPVDRAALETVAAVTGGENFPADSAEALLDVYGKLGRSVTTTTETREITDVFVGAALVLLGLAVGASLLWSSRVP